VCKCKNEDKNKRGNENSQKGNLIKKRKEKKSEERWVKMMGVGK
jgi:hypothetical protein